MLKCDNLLSFVDGTKSEPSTIVKDSTNTDIPNPANIEWLKRHDKVLSLLLSSLTEEAMVEVVGITKARDVWLALEAAFNPSSPSHAQQLRDEL